MGDPSRPRGCFPPLHISRTAESGAIKEEPKPPGQLWRRCWWIKCEHIGDFLILGKRDPCLFIDFKCTGEGKGQWEGRERRQGGGRRWHLWITKILLVRAKKRIYFKYLHCKLYNSANQHRLLYFLKQFCPSFYHWKHTELWITTVSRATAERSREEEWGFGNDMDEKWSLTLEE